MFSASSALKASFLHRDLPSATVAFFQMQLQLRSKLTEFVSRISREKDVPLNRANMRIWLKKVLDSRFPMLVTCSWQRSKKNLKKWIFALTPLHIWSIFRTTLLYDAHRGLRYKCYTTCSCTSVGRKLTGRPLGGRLDPFLIQNFQVTAILPFTLTISPDNR